MVTLADWWRITRDGRADFLITPRLRLGRPDLVALVEQMAQAFATAGLAEGDRVLIVLPDEEAAITVFVAALFDGVVPVMLTPDTPAERLAAIVASTEPGLAVIGAGRAGEAWLAAIPRRIVAQDGEGKRGWLGRRRSPGQRIATAFGLDGTRRPPRLPADPAGLAYLLFTSGTTSAPKGVMISRASLFANLATISRVLAIDGDGARIFNDMILAHADGMIQGPVMGIATAATLIRGGGFSVDRIEDWLAHVRREGATHFITVPTVWAMIERYGEHDDYFAHPGFRMASSCAANLDPALWDRIEQRFAIGLTNQYGLTETVASALYAGPHPDASSGAGSGRGIGRPVDCEARLVPVSGHDSGDDGVGELQLRGPNVFDGYWRDAAATADAFTPDGWLRTGDLARRADAGDYVIAGRIKRLIMTGGFLIRPEEIDEAMQRHPLVLGAATIAWPDAMFGEVAMTAVELAPSPAQPDERDLAAHARTVLERMKVPKAIVIVPAIPRGDAGKVRLDAVQALIADRLGAQGGAGHEASGAPADSRADDLEQAVIATAADVFRVSPDELSVRSTPDSVAGWDSFSHVAFILALEDRFGTRIPASGGASVRSLGGAVALLSAMAR